MKILKFALIIGVDFKFFEFFMTDIYTSAILSLYLDLILVSRLESWGKLPPLETFALQKVDDGL